MQFTPRFAAFYRGARRDQLLIGLSTLAALAIRLWAIGAKGLWYDEASTALMARATPAQITAYHWQAAFEHPPLWVLLMHFWSQLFGQSETALRWPAALSGALMIPVLWRLLDLCWPTERRQWRITIALVIFSPLLVLYSQEARMYALVALLALIEFYTFVSILLTGRWRMLIACVLVSWAMTGLHYYSVLMLAAEGLFLLTILPRGGRRVIKPAAALVVALLPILFWIALAPGFRATFADVLTTASSAEPAWITFLGRAWRDLTFGAVVWQPAQAALGYLLLPLFLLGVGSALWVRPAHDTPGALPWGRLSVLTILIPMAVSLAFPHRIHTRYILFIAPFCYLLIALGIDWLWRHTQVLGVMGLIAAAGVAFLGLTYYFNSYDKSGYRDVTRYVLQQAGPDDAIVLESPRQHLLAKYYLPASRAIYPMPPITLPDTWPVTAPPIKPEAVDARLREILQQHRELWLILAGQNEVDSGDFVEKYLRAIAFPRECRDQLDVRLCHFTVPSAVAPAWSAPLDALFGRELRLTHVAITPWGAADGRRDLLVTLAWKAEAKPTVDYTVSLRLSDRGGDVKSQVDDLPIGALLPPTTWQAGDRKPGYMVLPLPPGLPAGNYDLAVGLYDPKTAALFPTTSVPSSAGHLLPLARLQVEGSEIRVEAPRSD